MSIHISLTGNAVAPPENHASTNYQFTTVRVAVNQGYMDKQSNKWVDTGTMWLNVTLPKNSEEIARHINKGTRLIITGVLTQNEYTTKDGNKATSLNVRAQAVGLVPKPATTTPPAQQQQPQFDNQYQDNGFSSSGADMWADDINF